MIVYRGVGLRTIRYLRSRLKLPPPRSRLIPVEPPPPPPPPDEGAGACMFANRSCTIPISFRFPGFGPLFTNPIPHTGDRSSHSKQKLSSDETNKQKQQGITRHG